MENSRITVLVLTFISGVIYVPNWVFETFWNISLWEALPFDFYYGYFRVIYAVLLTIFVEVFMKLTRKYL